MKGGDVIIQATTCRNDGWIFGNSSRDTPVPASFGLLLVAVAGVLAASDAARGGRRLTRAA